MLDKTFRPETVEARLYAAWEQSGAFAAGRRPGAEPYCIMIPPPNVTGSLHIGHALNNTLQDILARFWRMRGRDVLWQPGMDHAGIATQLVVERELALEQKKRQDLGREAFLARVWAWKEKSGGAILNQLKRLGSSCDWSRERFTMDEGLSRAVTRVFVQLHRDGLIYKDKRLVNWDPRLQTAVSDLEVETIEVKGHLWYIKYPLADDPSLFVTVATTRPETMLGDVAVAVHPEDERYKPLVGKMLRLPLVGRLIPVIADNYSDPEKGTGAVKITPAHDFNDFEVGKRHGFSPINILNKDASLNGSVPEAYRGLDRFEARKRMVADLDAQGLIDKIEPITHAVPHDEKTKAVVLEPYLTEQWYLNVAPLAEKAIAAVEEGRTRFNSEQWASVYFQWLRNIQPWCISRQLWWGHQVPVWYSQVGRAFAAESEEEAQAAAAKHYGKTVVLTRDDDVLDTWFSSALWPFSTLGWPDETPELKRYYPTSVLVTAFDIIFFWVARMMMMGLHFMGEVPFRDVLIHNRVLDEKGQKMSKTKGNVVDPLVLIDQFGADALRFTLAIAAGTARDMRIGPQRVEVYRNFTTKLWNAARFGQMNECRPVMGFDPSIARETVNKWILGEAAGAIRAVTEAIETYRFNDAAATLYRFAWNIYCDWYVELIKPLLSDPRTKDETRATASFVFDIILQLLHPVMPFVTEELWALMAEGGAPRKSMLILADWPSVTWTEDTDAMAEMDWVLRFVNALRSVRAELNVPAGAEIDVILVGAGEAARVRLARHQGFIARLARAKRVETKEAVPKGAVQLVLDEATVALPLAGIIDIAQEGSRLKKELAKLTDDIGKLEAKLADETFVSRAPEDIIEENRERLAGATAARQKLAEALARISEAA